MRYDAARYLPDPRLRERIAALGWAERAALAEAMTGNMGIHILYAARAEDPALAADWSDPAAVPVLREVRAEQMARAAAAGALRVSFDGITLPLPLPRLAPAILRRVGRAAQPGRDHASTLWRRARLPSGRRPRCRTPAGCSRRPTACC